MADAILAVIVAFIGRRRPALLRYLSLLLLCLGILAALWTAAVLMSGGFVTHLGGLRISSRRPRNPALVAVLALAAAAVLSDRDARRRVRANLLPGAALVLTCAVVVTGFVWGARAAGGSDSFGYVSEARMWASGHLSVEQPIAREIPADLRCDVRGARAARLSAVADRSRGARADLFARPAAGDGGARDARRPRRGLRRRAPPRRPGDSGRPT